MRIDDVGDPEFHEAHEQVPGPTAELDPEFLSVERNNDQEMDAPPGPRIVLNHGNRDVRRARRDNAGLRCRVSSPGTAVASCARRAITAAQAPRRRG